MKIALMYGVAFILGSFAALVYAEPASAQCAVLPSEAITAVRHSVLQRKLYLTCSEYGHRLEPRSTSSWLNILNAPFYAYAAQPKHATTKLEQPVYFTRLTGRRLKQGERKALHAHFLQNIFPDYRLPSSVIEATATTSEGLDWRLFLMPDRGVLCYDQCSIRQVFMIKPNPSHKQDTALDRQKIAEGDNSLWSKRKIGWFIVLGLLHWPVLTVFLFFMLLPHIYNNLTTNSERMDWVIAKDIRGISMLPVLFMLQYWLLAGKYTADAKAANCEIMLRIGQGLVITNILVFINFLLA
ncbi:hypothetical protein [Alkalimonas mucilaginosa]|uniref:Uncharacterized protein n=1 Tax=Alkalimonas mucilaginosa TaxID=3057676 RepID=A0ABU7JBR6_9GAMM|nr:hypothetical protein [Alkalimonas sp. MEB004]MEE2023094.1 hypothetical protein [Alkalimonas sp. MEB004]